MAQKHALIELLSLLLQYRFSRSFVNLLLSELSNDTKFLTLLFCTTPSFPGDAEPENKLCPKVAMNLRLVHNTSTTGNKDGPVLKRLFKESVFLYRLWFLLVRARQVRGRRRLPKETDDLFYTGFPRSGNTYLAALIEYCFPPLVFTHHLHTVASIKIALSNNIKTFIVIRNPRDSISSFLAYHSDDLDSVPNEFRVRHSLTSYFRYFQFLNDNKDILQFISFENLIADKKILFVKLPASLACRNLSF